VTYISAMPKRSPRIKLFEWRVIKIRSTPATLIGYFTAANADDAIKRAIVERKISDPLAQSRLAGQKVREITEQRPRSPKVAPKSPSRDRREPGRFPQGSRLGPPHRR
jgi:hypothetical protein